MKAWIVRLKTYTVSDPRNLSIHQCEICQALVVEDYMPDHLKWHRAVVVLPEAKRL